jgi:hypothetical protein
MTTESQQSAIGQFALACEQMNDFARSLRSESVFGTVRTGADIRYYENGWRLEKWIEAELEPSQGLWSAWWLELGPHPDGWIVESSLSISPDALFLGFEDRTATSLVELEQCLADSVDNLKRSTSENPQFLEYLRRYRETNAAQLTQG